MRFAPRSSGQITSAFDLGYPDFVYQDLFINLFKRLAPGRAAGGVFNLTASGGKGGETTLGKNTLKAGCQTQRIK